ncbi:MAG: putative peptidoglycan glycosyltransferase FtsW [Puniceicoccaceae bacterium MED-G32]|jgi:cell division protein FtsW|nr:MAG: putative peptidoglycan glycosyltransferase FtsW [Puniceicoccaceae bacterium MED-G32]
MLKDLFWRNSLTRFPASGIIIILIVTILTLLGIIILFSASQAMHSNPTALLKKQMLWLVLGLGIGFFVFKLDLERIRPLVPIITGAALLLLVLVLIPGIGVKVNGAQRWLDFGFMRLQVSEIGKIGLLFCLAHYLAINRRLLDTWKEGFVFPFSLLGLFAGLIFLEPDYGTAFLCGLVGCVLFFVSGMKLRYLFPTAGSAFVLFCIAIVLNPERLSRITSFLDVESNRSDSGYQLWQGIIAFGMGGVEGVGLGSGQQQMSFLPEAHTDFIFSIIGEELGLFFSMGVVLLFLTLMILVLFQLKYAPNLYQYLLVLGSLLMIEFQALINIGVVTGCLPTKGMSLPFISYGGSNLVLMFVLIGVILNCLCHWSKVPLREVREL